MKTQHTPGPWFQHHSDASIRVCDGAHDSQDGCKTIAEAEIIGYDREVSKANARLIAAAPELLEACLAVHAEIIGLSAYLETCSPEVIVENLPGLIASLQRKKEMIGSALLKAKTE